MKIVKKSMENQAFAFVVGGLPPALHKKALVPMKNHKNIDQMAKAIDTKWPKPKSLRPLKKFNKKSTKNQQKINENCVKSRKINENHQKSVKKHKNR